MPLVVPLERPSVTGSSFFSSYKDVSRLESDYFVLQVRKDGKPSREGHRAAYRIITKGEHPFYIVAYGHTYEDILNNEWRYLTETLPTLMPSTLDLTNVKSWIVAHITARVLASPHVVTVPGTSAHVGEGSRPTHTHSECVISPEGADLPRTESTYAGPNDEEDVPTTHRLFNVPSSYGPNKSSSVTFPSPQLRAPELDLPRNASLPTPPPYPPLDVRDDTYTGPVGMARRVYTDVHPDAPATCFLRMPLRPALLMLFVLAALLVYVAEARVLPPVFLVTMASLPLALLLFYSTPDSTLAVEVGNLGSTSHTVLKGHIVLAAGTVYRVFDLLRGQAASLIVYQPLTSKPPVVSPTAIPADVMCSRASSYRASFLATPFNAPMAGVTAVGASADLDSTPLSLSANAAPAVPLPPLESSRVKRDYSRLSLSSLPFSLPALSSLKRISNLEYPRARSLPSGYAIPAPGTTFPVRQVGYVSSGVKAPSADCFYEFCGADLLKSPNKIDHIMQRLTLPLPPSLLRAVHNHQNPDAPCAADAPVEDLRIDADAPLPPALFAQVAELCAPRDDFSAPPYLVVCFQGPLYAPSMFGSTFDGEGLSLLFFFALHGANRRKVVQLCRRGDAGATLLQRFAAADLVSRKDTLKGRFKGLPNVLNLSEVDLGVIVGNTINKYNGKPFLTGPVHQRWYQGPNYLEDDVDIHEYCYVARKAASHAIPLFKDMRIQIGFAVEGRCDEELPEQVLGAAEVGYIDLHAATDADDLYPVSARQGVDSEGLVKLAQQLEEHYDETQGDAVNAEVSLTRSFSRSDVHSLQAEEF